jgi:hypothetical protein
MNKKPSDNIISNTITTNFQNHCKTCQWSNGDCIRGSGLSLTELEYWKMIHNKQTFTEEDLERMEAGKRWHEEMTGSYKTLDEYGIDNFKNDFEAGKEIILRELKTCNPSLPKGRRGTFDLIRFHKIRDKILIDIIELKSGFRKSNLDQLNHYSSIPTNSSMEIIYESKKKTRGIPFKGTNFIPENARITIRTLLISKRFGTVKKEIWMKDNVLTEFGRIGELLLQSKLKNYRRLHKMAIYKPILQKENQLFLRKRITAEHPTRKTHPIFKTVNLHENIAN